MTDLLDVYVLVALLDSGHVLHDVAHDWFGCRWTTWATCPVTENGTIRVISHPRYPKSTATASAAAELVSRLRGLPGHVCWPDAVSPLDPDVCEIDLLTASGQVTGSYLLALAVANSGSLATFDKWLVTSAICGADAALVVLPADQARRGDPIEPWRRCSPPEVGAAMSVRGEFSMEPAARLAGISPGEARQPGRLHPGCDYLVHRKFSSIWRDVIGTQIGADLDEFIAAARTAEYRHR